MWVSEIGDPGGAGYAFEAETFFLRRFDGKCSSREPETKARELTPSKVYRVPETESSGTWGLLRLLLPPLLARVPFKDLGAPETFRATHFLRTMPILGDGRADEKTTDVSGFSVRSRESSGMFSEIIRLC